MILKVRPRLTSKISRCTITSTLWSTLLTSTISPPVSNGVTLPSANNYIADFCPASRTRLPTSANLTPSPNSIPSPSLLTPEIGSAVLRWPEKIQPPTRMNALTIKRRATKNPTPLRILIKIKITTAERVTPVTLVILMLEVAILTRRSPTLTFPQSLEKTASSPKQSDSTVLSRTSACSAAKPDTSPKSVTKRLPLPPKPAPPSPWTRTLMPSLA